MKWFGSFTEKAGSSGVFVVLTAIICLFHSPAGAITTNVDCSTGTLQSAIDNATSGDVLMVTGTCNENIILKKSGLTLNGGGTGTTTGAIIKAAVNTQPVVLVEAHDTIEGFTIQGGAYGVSVWGGSLAVIADNIIQNNTGSGVLVTDNSTALIGVFTTYDTTASPNTINSNGYGIEVVRSSSARIIGNTISSNSGDGIWVSKVSQADISDNVIDLNLANGVEVSGNSLIKLGDDKNNIFGLPNYTYTKNLAAGIACNIGGSVVGFEGSLNGVKGVLSADNTCVKSIQNAASDVLLVGTWTVTYVNPPRGGDPKAPVQITVNADGTGTGVLENSTPLSFNWSLSGITDNKLIITTTTNSSTGTITWQGGNDFTWSHTSTDNPGTHIYKFHRIVELPG